MNTSHLRLVPPSPEQREHLERLVAKGVLCAVRRLRARGIDRPELAPMLAEEAMHELMQHLHAHAGGTEAFRLLCSAIERLIERRAGQTGQAN